MDKFAVTDKIFQYHFNDSKSDFSNSITFLVEGNKVIFFDIAYKRHMEKVLADPALEGVADFVAFLSHHHDDHFGSVELFEQNIIYGADNFQDDYQEHLDDDYLINFQPGIKLIDNEEYKIAGNSIKALYTPGHNIAHYSFLINNKIIFAGDLLYFNKAGKPCIPYIDENSTATQHLESLKKIMNLGVQIMIVGHGKHISGAGKIKSEINDRIYYLEKLIESNGEAAIEECLLNDAGKYGGLNFHEMNKKRIDAD